jgi:translation initiation factor IF-3
VLQTHEALRIAEEKGLDLVEVSPKAMPPVCKIMDYGKFKYEDAKKRKEARKHQSTIEYKEVKFRPKTDDHDFDFKVKNIRRFLGEGNKARLVVVFRGREIVHPETGQDMLRQVFKATEDIAMIEQAPLMEGRRMLMVIAPKAGGAAVRRPDPVAPAAEPAAAAAGQTSK